jgi:hypothetical protein
VKHWFLHLIKYWKEIEFEQKKHPGKCIYHLTKSHPTEECTVKKECDRIIADKSSGDNLSVNNSSKQTGQLKNVKEEVFENAVDQDAVENS